MARKPKVVKLDTDKFKDFKLGPSGRVELQYNHKDYGWIPFSASPDDEDEISVEVFKILEESGIKVDQLSDSGTELQVTVFLERSWRDSELSRADVELIKAEDDDGVGTPQEWRAYRKALRAWPKDSNFPNSEFRPVAPDFKTED